MGESGLMPFLPYLANVYSPLQLASRYARYYLGALNGKGHGAHSPFVFDFIRHVLNNDKCYCAPAMIEQRRKALLRDKSSIQIEDMGAGSSRNSAPSRTVSQVAATALKPPKYAQLLHRLAAHYQPHTIIELGTSLGITTSYLATGHPQATVYTIEGSPAIAAKAAEGFGPLLLKNVHPLIGNFDTVLPQLLSELNGVDLAYIDGNHRYAPTVNYFSQLLPHCNEGSILVFDDIHWSAEMENAWEVICSHEAVQYTIDIFFLGFVFFRKGFKVKQHFSIRF